jgi:S1-C subfamily serine protease
MLEIKIILPDKREFSAELIGRDPNDHNIKAKSRRLMQNSDVQIGEWVLAIGFPLY